MAKRMHLGREEHPEALRRLAPMLEGLPAYALRFQTVEQYPGRFAVALVVDGIYDRRNAQSVAEFLSEQTGIPWHGPLRLPEPFEAPIPAETRRRVSEVQDEPSEADETRLVRSEN